MDSYHTDFVCKECYDKQRKETLDEVEEIIGKLDIDLYVYSGYEILIELLKKLKEMREK